jgi:glutaredoxin 1
MREWIRVMDAKPVVVIDGLAFANGSLSSEFLDKYDGRLPPDELLASIAHDYQTSVASGERVARIALQHRRQITPDTCRAVREEATSDAADQKALQRLGCYASFGGSSYGSRGRVMMSTGGAWQEAPRDAGQVEAGAAYYLDLRMSRMFRRPGETHTTYGCAILRDLPIVATSATSPSTSPSWSIECRYMTAPSSPLEPSFTHVDPGATRGQTDQHITVYGYDGCGWCGEARRLLDKAARPYTYTDLDHEPRAEAHVVAQGHTTVPQIFSGDSFLGGYTQLEQYLRPEK